MGFLGLGGLIASGIGSIIGSNAQNHAANAAQGAADAATAAQNQLIQKGQLPALQALLNSYQQNYQPYEGNATALNTNLAGGLGNRDLGGDLSNVMSALYSQRGADEATGIPVQGLLESALGYLTGGPVQLGAGSQYGSENRGQSSGQAYSNGPVRNLQNNTPGNAYPAGGLTHGNYSYGDGQTATMQGSSGSVPIGVTGVPPGINPYTGQPDPAYQSTAYSAPGVPMTSAMAASAGQAQGMPSSGGSYSMAPSASFENSYGARQGKTALDYYNHEAQQGLDPQYINSALSQSNNSFLSGINSIRNLLGAGLPNASGLVNDLTTRHTGDLLQLLGTLGAQNQQIKDRAMGSALETAGGIDTAAQNRMSTILQLSSAAQNQQLNNMQTAYGLGTNGVDRFSQYITSGKSSLPGAATGFQALQQQYGNAANTAATNLGQIRSAPNPFLGFATQAANTAAQNGWFSGKKQNAPDWNNASFGDY